MLKLVLKGQYQEEHILVNGSLTGNTVTKDRHLDLDLSFVFLKKRKGFCTVNVSMQTQFLENGATHTFFVLLLV